MLILWFEGCSSSNAGSVFRSILPKVQVMVLDWSWTALLPLHVHELFLQLHLQSCTKQLYTFLCKFLFESFLLFLINWNGIQKSNCLIPVLF